MREVANEVLMCLARVVSSMIVLNRLHRTL